MMRPPSVSPLQGSLKSTSGLLGLKQQGSGTLQASLQRYLDVHGEGDVAWSQRVQLGCQYGIRAQLPDMAWFLGSNSIVAL